MLENPKTVDHLFHRLWTLRATETPYDKDKEKPLWRRLARFIEANGGLKEKV